MARTSPNSGDDQRARATETESTRPPWFSEGVIVAGLTALGYATSFAADAGRALHYGLPASEAHVTGLGVALGVGCVQAALLLEGRAPRWIARAWRGRLTAGELRLPSFMATAVAVTMLGILGPDAWPVSVTAGTLTHLALALGPLSRRRRRHPFRPDDVAISEEIGDVLLGRVASVGALGLLSIAFFSLLIAATTGRALEAVRTTWAVFESDGREFVVVHWGNERAWGIELDRRNLRLSNELRVFPLDETTSFTREQLGRLRRDDRVGTSL